MGWRLVRWSTPLVTTMLLAACGTATLPGPSVDTDRPASEVRLASVPFYPQTLRNDCGPAALAMMLRWTGVATDPKTLAPMVYTPGREGTLQADIVQASRRTGRLVLPVRSLNDLLTELDAGNPVLVLQNLRFERWPKWHYAVAVGYDLASRRLWLHSGNQAEMPVSFEAFEQTWRRAGRWGLTITTPDRLPATAEPAALLQAANALEQAKRPESAALAYGAVLARWPDNFAALMGWGNARYAAGDLEAASGAFRQAALLHPDSAGAWNNLAYSLAEQGRLDDALEAADQAVRLGGPHRQAAEATLAEIRAMRG